MHPLTGPLFDTSTVRSWLAFCSTPKMQFLAANTMPNKHDLVEKLFMAAIFEQTVEAHLPMHFGICKIKVFEFSRQKFQKKIN